MDRSQPFDAAALLASLRERARELGASALRVTGAGALDETREAMVRSFERGDFTTWNYDSAYARAAADPQHVLPGARSIICLAFPYRVESPSPGPLEGRVSSYAWPRDYHRRVKAALAQLAQAIDECAGAPVTAIACDTKPLAERAFAARAGLGWIGKHTNLIAPGTGSFVFLGEIVTTLDLPADAALKKTCGSCARCIPACPTGALRGDYTIDAGRCISDLTQRTDAIPLALRPLVGTWVWGCDICQEVCPPNLQAPLSNDQPPASRETSAPDLLRLLHLRSGDFKRLYRETAMGWRGAAVLRRNAAVALGNALDRSSVPALVVSLREDPHPMVRGHAAWALGRIGSQPAVDALAAASETEGDAGVREEIFAALEPFAQRAR